jgi:uncharacterized protein
VMEEGLSGVFNGVAPFPVTNSEFSRELARALHRPAFLGVPEFGLKLLFGEMAQLVLDSQRAGPRAAESGGFRFRFPQLGPALTDLLRK